MISWYCVSLWFFEIGLCFTKACFLNIASVAAMICTRQFAVTSSARILFVIFIISHENKDNGQKICMQTSKQYLGKGERGNSLDYRRVLDMCRNEDVHLFTWPRTKAVGTSYQLRISVCKLPCTEAYKTYTADKLTSWCYPEEDTHVDVVYGCQHYVLIAS